MRRECIRVGEREQTVFSPASPQDHAVHSLIKALQLLLLRLGKFEEFQYLRPPADESG